MLPAGRGTIFDAMGTPLALGEQATTIFADPRQITHPLADATIAARVLHLKPRPLARLLDDRTHGFVYVERKAPPVDATALAQKNLVGFGFYAEERRVYPQKSVAAPVLGYAGVDNNGLCGSRAAAQLAADRQARARRRSSAIRSVTSSRSRTRSRRATGKNVFLTLDHTIQANAEQVLRATVAKWHAKDATAIVLDPHTGGVLAMAMEPGYDANIVPVGRGGAAEQPRRDRRVRAGLGVQDRDHRRRAVGASRHAADDVHAAVLDPRRRPRHPRRGAARPTERMTVAQILQRSSNVGAITIATKLLGQKRLQEWISRFGFGKQTGIDFPGESSGLLPSYWSGSTIGNVPIGQGISVTAIQLASVYAAIANGGVWIQPHLVDHVQGEQPSQPTHAADRLGARSTGSC